MYIIIGISIFLLFAIVILPEIIRHREQVISAYMENEEEEEEEDKNMEVLVNSFLEKKKNMNPLKETKLLQSNEIPTDEHILLYYKMYLKKWELDHKDLFLTDSIKPIKFDEWEKAAKTMDGYGGYGFIISNTMDMFITMGKQGSMMRCNDYKKMVLDEERSQNE